MVTVISINGPLIGQIHAFPGASESREAKGLCVKDCILTDLNIMTVKLCINYRRPNSTMQGSAVRRSNRPRTLTLLPPSLCSKNCSAIVRYSG